jgi:hypothetical protein
LSIEREQGIYFSGHKISHILGERKLISIRLTGAEGRDVPVNMQLIPTPANLSLAPAGLPITFHTKHVLYQLHLLFVI